MVYVVSSGRANYFWTEVWHSICEPNSVDEHIKFQTSTRSKLIPSGILPNLKTSHYIAYLDIVFMHYLLNATVQTHKAADKDS